MCQEGERKTLDMGEVEAQQNEHHDTNVLHTWSQMGPPSAQHLGTYHNKDLGFKEPLVQGQIYVAPVKHWWLAVKSLICSFGFPAVNACLQTDL